MTDDETGAPRTETPPIEPFAPEDTESEVNDAAPDNAAPDDGLTPRERRELRLRERARRKRERRIWVGLVVASLVALALFMFAVWPLMAGRLEAAKQMDQALALLEQAKPTVDEIDKVVAVQLSARATAGVPDVAPQRLVARRELKQGLALIDDAMPHLTDDEQKRAKAIRAGLKARLDMVDRAPGILVASAKAVKAKELVDQAWKATQVASAAETAASARYKTGTASGVASASVSLQRIKGQFGDGRDLYSQAASAFPGAGFEYFATYLDQRVRAAKLFSAATAEWLAGDRSGAAADFSAYQRTLARAKASATKLPSAPAAPAGAFRRAAGRAVDAYEKAKKQAAEADKALGGL